MNKSMRKVTMRAKRVCITWRWALDNYVDRLFRKLLREHLGKTCHRSEFLVTGDIVEQDGDSLSSSVIGIETRQMVSLSASTTLKSLVFLILMRSLSSPIVIMVEVEIGKALEVVSPSMRQNRLRRLSVIVFVCSIEWTVLVD